jgi:hypothetical protein
MAARSRRAGQVNEALLALRVKQPKIDNSAQETGRSEDWQQHGREVLKRVRRESPAAYLKVCALLVPREMKLEHSGGVKAMTDEQLERGIELIKEMLAQREAGANAKVLEGESEVVPSWPAPDISR